MRSFTLALPLIVLLSACSGSTEPPIDTSRCLQTSESANDGCAVVAGLVTDSAGRAVWQASVSVLGSVDSLRSETIAGGNTQTDTSGHFRVRVLRMTTSPSAGMSDTLSVWVRASVPPPTTSPIGTKGPTDSTVVVLHWQPVGTPPDTAYVPTIVLLLSTP